MISTLDSKVALVVIDLQQGLLGYPTIHPLESVIAVSASLADAFRARGLPVVLVNVDGPAPGRTEQKRGPASYPAAFSEIVPALQRRPEERLVTKRTWGAFTNTELEAHLRSLGVTQIVLCGVATSIGVESTARHAYELGFNVALAIDAMTDLSAEAHANSVARIFPRLGETATAAQIIDLLGATQP